MSKARRAARLAWALLGLLALIATTSCASALGETWTVQRTAGPSEASDAALASISCASATSCVAVGPDSDGWSQAGSTALDPGAFAEALQGTSWAPAAVAQPASASPGLDGVSCASPELCLAVGAATVAEPEASGPATSAPLAELWNGTSWQLQEPVGAYNGMLTGVSCVSSAFCMAVGHFNAAGSSSSLRESALIETWNGAQWQSVQPARLPGVQYSVLNAVSCVQPDACVAVGGYYPGGASTLSFNQEVPLAEGWNGTRWAREAVPAAIDRQLVRSRQYVAFRAVSCTASDVCLAAGSANAEQGPSRPWAATLRGGRWTSTPRLAGLLDGGEIAGVSCLSASQCVAVGSLSPHAFENASGAFGLTWRTEALAEGWNGRSWSRGAVAVAGGSSRLSTSLTPAAPAFGGVSCVPGGSCFAVGAQRAGSHSTVLTATTPSGQVGR